MKKIAFFFTTFVFSFGSQLIAMERPTKKLAKKKEISTDQSSLEEQLKRLADLAHSLAPCTSLEAGLEVVTNYINDRPRNLDCPVLPYDPAAAQLMQQIQEQNEIALRRAVLAKLPPAMEWQQGTLEIFIQETQRKQRLNQLLLTFAGENLEGILKLIQAGAQVNFQDENGWTPLKAAAKHGMLLMANLLIKSGAVVDLQDSIHHETALMIAAKNGQTAVVRLLLHAKANRNLQNKSGFTAFDLAKQEENTFCCQALNIK